MLVCKCGAEADRLNERSEPCCETCPLTEDLDSVRITDVSRLLGWTRLMLEYLVNGHVPAGDSIKMMLGVRPARRGPGNENCNCRNPGWGGHNDSNCADLNARIRE